MSIHDMFRVTEPSAEGYLTPRLNKIGVSRAGFEQQTRCVGVCAVADLCAAQLTELGKTTEGIVDGQRAAASKLRPDQSEVAARTFIAGTVLDALHERYEAADRTLGFCRGMKNGVCDLTPEEQRLIVPEANLDALAQANLAAHPPTPSL